MCCLIQGRELVISDASSASGGHLMLRRYVHKPMKFRADSRRRLAAGFLMRTNRDYLNASGPKHRRVRLRQVLARIAACQV
jgi:hypothetical protein